MTVRTEAKKPVTLNSLPKSYATRWVAGRKAQVVEAVQSDMITLDEALTRYRLSLHEFISWQRALQDEGLDGLKSTHERSGAHPQRRQETHRLQQA